ncbi:hypothetical protein Tco_1491307 [Tanacetum coccineum]
MGRNGLVDEGTLMKNIANGRQGIRYQSHMKKGRSMIRRSIMGYEFMIAPCKSVDSFEEGDDHCESEDGIILMVIDGNDTIKDMRCVTHRLTSLLEVNIPEVANVLALCLHLRHPG